MDAPREPSTLVLLLSALRAAYPRDPSGPGVQVADIGRGEFYAAVHRFREQYGEGKYVVCKQRGPDLSRVIRLLAVDWLANHAPSQCVESAVIDVLRKRVEVFDASGAVKR